MKTDKGAALGRVQMHSTSRRIEPAKTVRRHLRLSHGLIAVMSGLLLSGCVRDRCSSILSLFGCVTRDERHPEDASIVFPSFHGHVPVHLDASEGGFELDGRVLRALQLAADDFLPPGGKGTPCWARQEAHSYRVVRQGDVLFVRIDENPVACGRELPALHSGARYAISLDGRILKRLLDGEPDGTSSAPPASTSPAVQAEPGIVTEDRMPSFPPPDINP